MSDTNEKPIAEQPARNHAVPVRMLRWASVAAAVLLAVVAWRVLVPHEWAADWRDWLRNLGWRGPLVFGGIYVLATVAMLPGSAITLLSGAAFGLWTGFVTVSLASTTGAALAFLIARYLARRRIEDFARKNPRFRALDRAMELGGWRVVVLLRLSPAVPFNLQNYLYGLTAIRFWPCVLASWVAMWPGTFMYVYLGHIAGFALGKEENAGPWRWALLAVGLAATVALTVYLTQLAKRALREQSIDE